jgi:hypothetical protein
MDERYLTSFEDQITALDYTSGDTTLVSPQVSLVGADEVVYSKEIPNESRIRFAKDEVTGKLYFVVDGVYYDVTELVKKSIPLPSEGYGEGVDLGLSVKWADRNVGAENPWDNGAYFSWGNVEGVVYGTTKKSEDDVIRILLIQIQGIPADEITQEMIDTIKLEAGENLKTAIEEYLKVYTFISGTTFDENTYSTTLGGQYTGSELDAEHDAATVNMGDGWRMPTSAETTELVEGTDHYYIDLEGNILNKDGFIIDESGNTTEDKIELSSFKKLRSICFVKKDATFNYNNRSNFIEFPFAGYCFGSVLDKEGVIGSVYSSSIYEDNVQNVRELDFDSGGILYGDSVSGRYGGQSVRGVRA